MTRKWTRHHVFYDGIETALDVYILAKSWEWRQAWLKKNAEDYALSVSEQQVRQEAGKRAHARGMEYVVALAGEIGQGLQGVRSPWKLYLSFDDGRQVEPLEIRKLKWPEVKMRSRFYFWTPWQKVYNVCFSEVPQGSYSLVLAGPFGPVSFSWDVVE